MEKDSVIPEGYKKAPGMIWSGDLFILENETTVRRCAHWDDLVTLVDTEGNLHAEDDCIKVWKSEGK